MICLILADCYNYFVLKMFFTFLLIFTFFSLSSNLQVELKTPQLISPSPSLTTLPKPPSNHVISGGTHTFQTFNNCGPAALSMALSYYNINVSQKTLGDQLRPWQNTVGDNDDKSVTLEELAAKASDYELTPIHLPIGNEEIIKHFVSLDIPIITRTWLKVNDDIGHYRVIKGYDETGIIQDDSLQGRNLFYTYKEFNDIWVKFNYEYLVLVPSNKLDRAKAIIGDSIDPKIAWNRAVELSNSQLAANPSDIAARFNLSVALYNVGDYQGSIAAFEHVEQLLPFRTLWYQIEPILAYYELGMHDRVLSLTTKILNNQNRAFSELYVVRGKIFESRGDMNAARQEYAQAIKYNSGFKDKLVREQML